MFGDKWSLLIVRDLMFRGRTTYGEFLGAGEGISTNILANRLKSMEADGIISKTRDLEDRKKYIYGLTKKGLELMPILLEVVRWSGKFDPNTGAPKDFLERLENDREGILKELMDNFNI
ncbi:Transcriptional regulator, HxlR family [hydrothermal vent metagenome]|uniref:Transcriptional regulator, HxlR family n=1 Tax=hydrothermal vent metagenome TaxID=652676 RepID=A0A3B0W9B9_9ZZZZ